MNKLNPARWAVVALLTVLTAGCGGINASQSVSPLDLLLPGLIQAPPAAPSASPAPTNSVDLVAQVRS